MHRQKWMVPLVIGLLSMIAGILTGERATEVGAFHIPIMLNVFGLALLIGTIILREETRLQTLVLSLLPVDTDKRKHSRNTVSEILTDFRQFEKLS